MMPVMGFGLEPDGAVSDARCVPEQPGGLGVHRTGAHGRRSAMGAEIDDITYEPASGRRRQSR